MIQRMNHVTNPEAEQVFDVLTINETVQPTPKDPCTFSVTLTVELPEKAKSDLAEINHLKIIDTIRGRESLATCMNDHSFLVDQKSCKVAFVHQPGDKVNLRPVKLETSEEVSLFYADTQTSVFFLAGTLWSAEAAAQKPDRNYCVQVTFHIHSNPGVKSDNSKGIPDIPANICVQAEWTSGGKDLFQVFPGPLLYIPPKCVTCKDDDCSEKMTDLVKAVMKVREGLEVKLYPVFKKQKEDKKPMK